MRLRDLAATTAVNLSRRRLRSVLTILAVVIGAMMIDLMVSLSSGIQSFVIGQFGLYVPRDAMFVSSGWSPFTGGGRGGPPQPIRAEGNRLAEPLSGADLEAIRAAGGVREASYVVSVPALSLRAGSSGSAFTASVDTAPLYAIRLRRLVAGRYFGERATSECLIPYAYVQLFGWRNAADAIGRAVTIEVGRLNPYDPRTQAFGFTVVGVLQNTLNSSEVLVPIGDAITMARFYQGDPLLYSAEEPGLMLEVRASDPSRVDAVAGEIRRLGFQVTTPGDILARIDRVFSTVEAGLAALGIIALVVAAIGIVNTLMMAVYERTREIGIMKAVGATKETIRRMFTLEGAAIGLAGGALGVLLAWGIGQLIDVIGRHTFLRDYPGFTLLVLPFWLPPAIIAVTTAASLLAAVYPASRAAALDPVDSLRYE